MSVGTHAARHAVARSPWRRPGGIAVIAFAVVLGLLGSGLLVWHASYAAFTSTTSNGANSFSAGTVALTDDDSAAVMFNVTKLKPGSTGSSCITVTYNGNLATAGVKLYVKTGDLVDSTPSIGSYINFTVNQGTDTNPTTFGDCTGFAADGSGQPIVNNVALATIATSNTSYANGVGGIWAPSAAGSTKVYKFDYTLSSSAPDTVQGLTATVKFTWEAQNS